MRFRSLDCYGANKGTPWFDTPDGNARRCDATFDCPNADAPRSDARFDGTDVNAPRSNDEFGPGLSTP
jgi:hypothetical protein